MIYQRPSPEDPLDQPGTRNPDSPSIRERGLPMSLTEVVVGGTLKPDGTTLRGDQSCSSGYSSGSLSLAQNGTYTVIIRPSSTAIGTFSLAVSTP